MFEKDVYDKVKELSKELLPDCLEFIQKLIRTPSVSGNEEEVADLIYAELEKLGYDKVWKDKFGNVFGKIYGEPGGPTIMYNSHMDHVDPGNPDNWEGYDPYGGEIDVCLVDNTDRSKQEKAECIHGRGASDVKSGHGFQIYAGAALIKLREMGVKFKGTFFYSGVVQEETGQNAGTRFMLDEAFASQDPEMDFDGMVSSEATSLGLYLGHRGRVEYLITVFGRTSHGSKPQAGINAVYKAMPVIEKIQKEVIPNLPQDPDGEVEGASISLNIIECKPGALSIVPDECLLYLDRRTMIGETAETAMADLQEVLDDIAAKDPEFKAKIEVTPAKDISYTGEVMLGSKVSEPWKMPKDHNFTKACAAALEAVQLPVHYGYWSFATDGGVTAGKYKKPTIGFSGMQEQYAHTPYDKCRTDYIEQSIAGNVAIFLKASELDKKDFTELSFEK